MAADSVGSESTQPHASDERAAESSLARDVTTGKDPATPFVALGGTALLIAILFALAVGIAVLAYLIAS